MAALREGLLVGIGNPLLDITVQGNQELLDKYKLSANDAIIAETFQLPLYEEITAKSDVEYTAGGSTQNSLRVCQWILRKQNVCVFFGSVGIDSYSDILGKKAIEAGVNVRYQFQKDVPTGTCAVIVTSDKNKHYRSLCANLAAANCFTTDHLEKPDNLKLALGAEYFYIGGFFHTVCPSAIMTLADIAKQHNKIVLTNLSAPFICSAFIEPLMNLMPYVDVLFGNETEALTLASTLKFGITDIKEIALKISSLPKLTSRMQRIVIITQGQLPVLFVQDGVVKEVEVFDIPIESIVDTNGAGDAFVGGFLSQFIQKKSIEECVKCGIWTACHVIQQSGCSFDTNLTYHSNSYSEGLLK